MKIVFVSNYLNHHQIPFCRSMYGLTGGEYTFIQTEPVEEERVRMGWGDAFQEPYLKIYYQEPELCKTLVNEADVVIFGGTDDESYIQERLQSGRLILRYSERLYKTGQWKAVSPRGLRKKYLDHTRYRRSKVYLLCAGAYVPSDFQIVRAYPGKMFCWGYFPETRHYDIEELLDGKGYPAKDGGEKIPYLLWTGRMIDWKHPELAVETARALEEKGIPFHLDMIGGGSLEEEVKALIRRYGLEHRVSLPGFMTPEKVREHMEQADIYLFTSDRQEGWGAVANEAMNSGCALVADHMIGAAPYLIRQGENGFLYRDGDREMLFRTTMRLLEEPGLRRQIGRSAYHTISETWNAENAAKRLYALIERLMKQADGDVGKRPERASAEEGFQPCQPALPIPERKMFRFLTKTADRNQENG